MDGLINRELKERHHRTALTVWLAGDLWRVCFGNTSVYPKDETSNFAPTESSNIWAAATHVQPTFSTCRNVLSDIQPPQLMGEFMSDSNYTSGLLPFDPADWHPINIWRQARFGGAAAGQPLLFWLALISTVLLGGTQMRINSVSFEGWARRVLLFQIFQEVPNVEGEEEKAERSTLQFQFGLRRSEGTKISKSCAYPMLVFSGILVNL